MKKKKSILIVSGGSIDVDFAKEYLRERQYDHIVAADSGLAHCKEIGIEPTDILGDFDSLRNLELLEYYRQKGIPLREFPTRKDYTDTHLAVKYAIDLKAEEVTILGATGTRYDHTLANISLLALLRDEGIDAQIVDVHNEIEILRGPAEKKYKKKYGAAYDEALKQVDDHIGESLLSLYDLGNTSTLTEVLFMERCLRLLKKEVVWGWYSQKAF